MSISFLKIFKNMNENKFSELMEKIRVQQLVENRILQAARTNHKN